MAFKHKRYKINKILIFDKNSTYNNIETSV